MRAKAAACPHGRLRSYGLTGLVFVLDKKSARDAVFKAAMACYVPGVLDISLNILLSGWVGWGKP